jgi:dTDP-4-dehydrorhamnose 3,5-epimerase
MSEIVNTEIEGVQIVKPKKFGDSRGYFYEGFRASWFPGDRKWVQWNISRSSVHVVRGLHFHKLQTDYWTVTDGLIRVALVDLRKSAPSYKKAICLDLDATIPQGVIIPPGVLHGYRILRDATMQYLVDQEYTGGDEYAVKWNDRELGLPGHWYDFAETTVSQRDEKAPMLKDVKVD